MQQKMSQSIALFYVQCLNNDYKIEIFPWFDFVQGKKEIAIDREVWKIRHGAKARRWGDG